MSYTEYLRKTGQKDSREAWKWWKIEICGMSEREAIKASAKCYTPLKGGTAK